MSRFVVITADAEFERKVRAAASGAISGEVQSIAAVPFPGEPQAILDQLRGAPPEVLLLGPGAPADEALKLAAIFDLMFPEISVVLVHNAASDLAVQAMRAGIRDILPPGAPVDAIRVLLERASLSAASRRRGLAPAVEPERQRGRVIGVMSPKGGVGKTTVATNLAIGLGKVAPMSVVLVDLDIQFGDVASGLALKPENSLADAVRGAASSDSMVLKAYLTVHPAGIYVLAAPHNPVDAENISGDQVGHVLAQLAAEFNYVVVDTAPGIGEHVIATLEQATDVVWVCGMDIPSIRGMRSGMEILREAQLVPEGRHVVLNFADKYSGLKIADVEATIGVPVDVVLPRSRSIPLSTNKGVPLMQEGIRDASTKGLRSLVKRFEPDYAFQPHRKIHRRVGIS